MMTYNPPVENTQIKVRNPSAEPAIRYDDAGRPVNPPDWGIETPANRRDRNPFMELSEGAIVRGGNIVFTIRHLFAVEADATIVERDDDGNYSTEYTLSGRPVVRGGANAGMHQEFLELHCEARTAEAT